MENDQQDTGIVLRPYQEAAIQAWNEKLNGGLRRGVINLPTGCGKTVTGLSIAKRMGGRTLWLAHRDELIEQPLRAIRAVWPEVSTGVVKADRNETDAQVVFGSIQTVSRENRLKSLSGFDFVVVDECFVAGTIVDKRPIESLSVGDTVTAWDKKTSEFRTQTVTRMFRKKAPQCLIRITANGRTVVCTANHPFLSSTGAWIKAGDFAQGDHIYAVSDLWESDEQKLLSLPKMLSPDHGRTKQKRCPRTHEETQSHVKSRSTHKDAHDTTQNPAPSENPRWEWPPVARTATPFGRSVKVANGVYFCDQGRAQERHLPEPLQTRYSKPIGNVVSRNRRHVALLDRAQSTRRPEGQISAISRVDRVEILKRGSDGEFERVCPDDYVYNLEVTGSHTYTANGFIVHNCHHAAADSYLRTINALGCFKSGGTPALGLTATVERGDSLGLDESFEEIVYQMQLLQAIKDGWLVDLRMKQVALDFDLDAITTVNGDYNQGQLGDAMLRAGAADATANAYQDHAKGRKALIFTVTVDQARRTAETLKNSGEAAEWLCGETPIEERRAILTRLKTGETMVVANCAVLTEGFDEPSIDAIIIARPTQSKTLYLQMIGRGTRIFPGKEDCLIIDLAGASRKHKLIQAPVLFGLDPDEAEDNTVTEALEVRDRETALVSSLVTANRAISGPRQFHWISAANAFYAASAGDRGTVLLIRSGDGWVVEVSPKNRFAASTTLESQPVDLELAQGIGEDYIRRASATQLAAENAFWRRKPASEKLLAALAKWRIPVHSGIRAGEASDLLTVAIAKAWLWRRNQ